MDGRCKGQTGGQMNQKNPEKQQHKHNQSTDQQS